MNANSVAVVTGASSGIGAATALALARTGADVVVHARGNRVGAEATATQIRQLGRRAHVVLADLRDEAAHETLVAAAWDWQGHVEVWVNNAGADVLTGEAAEWSFERKLNEIWRVDVLGTIRLSRLVGQRMFMETASVLGSDGVRAAGAGDSSLLRMWEDEVASEIEQSPGARSIINIGWDQAQQGMAGDSGEMFAASKGAVMAFTRSLAQTLAPQVRVNCVAPGWIRTAWGTEASTLWQQRAVAESLLERWGTPDDVAATIAFLASAAAGFITGQVISVNGGYRFGPTRTS